MVDMSRVSTQTNRSNLEHAFGLAEQLGVARLLDPEGEPHSLCYKSRGGEARVLCSWLSCVAFVTISAFTSLRRRRRSVSG